jgi:hypothetical protein
MLRLASELLPPSREGSRWLEDGALAYGLKLRRGEEEDHRTLSDFWE